MEYIQPTKEIIALIGVDEKTTRAFYHTHPVEMSSTNRFNGALLYPHNYIVEDKIHKIAEREYNKMKSERLKSAQTLNLLTFVGMGMAYEPKYEDDVCNHRIRTEITNPEGRRFFIEVGTGRGDKMRIDFVIDRDQEDLYEEKRAYYRDKIYENGGFSKCGVGNHWYDEFQKYESQPYYWYKKDEWFSLNVEYTKENVVKLVNRLFDCKFTSMQIDNYFLRTEDYQSKSL